MKTFFKNYLQFSRKERLGVFILLVLIAVFIILPEVYQPPLQKVYFDTALYPFYQKQTNHVYDTLRGNTNYELAFTVPKRPIKPTHLFSFDPNKATAAQWESLGLTPQNIRTIFNYLGKGGRFKQATDLKKIWGIPLELAEQLIPYATIEDRFQLDKTSYKNHGQPLYKKPEIPIIEINTAMQADWEALPGIGPVLAARIIKFREKLGGFKALHQVQKTYGISDSLYQQIEPFLKLNNVAIPSIEIKPNINKASIAELIAASVPEDIAKAIVLYRKQYGLFSSMADLKKIVFINEQLFEQIAPKLQAQ